MNTIISIFRWLIALTIGFFLFIGIIVTVPLSIAGKQLFEKQSGMAWLTTFTNDKDAVAKVIDGAFEGAASSSAIDDPMIKEGFKMAADKSSPFGASVRKVFNPESVSENLLVNAKSFYTWLDGNSATFPLSYKFGGTATEQVGMVSSFLKLRYEQLDACTSSERKELGKIDASNVMVAPCSVGAISVTTFDTAAKKLLSEPEAKKILVNGVSSDAQVTAGDRDGVLALKKVVSGGVLFSWVMLVISALFMVLLFTPSGVNFIATGVIVGMTGLILGGIGQGLSSVAAVLKDTLGTHIALQGLYIALFGLLLTCIGVWQIIQRKEPKEVMVKKVEESVAKKETKKQV